MLSSRFFRFFRYLNLVTLKQTVVRAMQRRLIGLSGEMAYNAMLALFPAILAILTAIGLFENSLQQTFSNLASQLKDLVPNQEAWNLISNFANGINLTKSRSLFSLSFLLAIWISSGALSAAMNALDEIHEIPRSQRRPFWKAKLVSIGLTIGSILLLVTASFLVFISDWLLRLVIEQSKDPSVSQLVLRVWQLLRWPIALSIIATSSAFIYRFGPSRWSHGTPLMPGALLAAISWAIVSALFRLYVVNFGNYNRVYGAVGAVIVLLLWFQITSLVLLLGDQLNVTVGEAMQKARSKSRLRKVTSKERSQNS
jgi:membrane protein